MNLVVDENIEFAEEAFSEFGNVTLMPGRDIKNSDLINTDVLITRSVTEVNAALLKNTPVRFVGTTTIGTDHIDKTFLKEKNISFDYAPGCNSWAVTEYVVNAIFEIVVQNKIDLFSKTIGIVGVGNIGSKVNRVFSALGLKTFLYDPPLERAGSELEFSTFEKILNCDIITFHVPLNLRGQDKTLYMLNEKNINKIKPNTILINSSRGAVINNTVLKNRLINNKNIFTVLDVWENEPNINIELLELVDLASAHIAGYSYEGKVNGTVMIYKSLCKFLNRIENWIPDLKNIKDSSLSNIEGVDEIDNLYSALNKTYKINDDSEKFKKYESSAGKHFDLLRKEYNLRRELNNYSIDYNLFSSNTKNFLKELRLQSE